MTEPDASAPLQPVTSFDSPTLEFDFPGLEIGCAEYEEGPTGCNRFPLPAVCKHSDRRTRRPAGRVHGR